MVKTYSNEYFPFQIQMMGLFRMQIWVYLIGKIKKATYDPPFNLIFKFVSLSDNGTSFTI
jgi:RPA family protein